MTISLKWAKAHNIAVIPSNIEPGDSSNLGPMDCNFGPVDCATLRVAMRDIHDELLLEKIKIAAPGKTILPVEHSQSEIQRLWKAAATAETSPQNLVENMERASTTWESEPIINLVDFLMEQALERRATDIHLEPGNDGFRVRFRIDGMLVDYRTLPAWLADPILIRLKLLAKADITERRTPHDGSFNFQGIKHEANVRLSTLPIYIAGQAQEKCVLRLLPVTEKEITLRELDIFPKTLDFLEEIFRKPQGLFLITGPTGSGKTTTLYAGLREVIGREINVTTIEDPVEYSLKGANQVQVNEKCGLTFAAALRSILRQDPDVILVGEIRDAETAKIALQAAQTGHLVFATLHTNSAKNAEERLADLGLDPKIAKEAIIGIMAQRLLRRRDRDKGRIAAMEILKPDGTYVEGNLMEYAQKLVQLGKTDENEVKRVIGQNFA